jgi:hypothetical protein
MPTNKRFVAQQRGVMMVLISVLIIVGVATGLYFYLRTTEHPLRIRELNWSRSIDVQSYTTLREQDWQLPEGGRLVSESQEVHHTDRVSDGSELKYRYNIFTHKWGWKLETKYKDVPVYKTKYVFDIERWVYDHSKFASGNNHDPYWPEVPLAEKERRGSEHETYNAVFEDTADCTRTFSRSYNLQEWQKLDRGGVYTGTFDSFDKLIEVKPLQLENK